MNGPVEAAENSPLLGVVLDVRPDMTIAGGAINISCR